VLVFAALSSSSICAQDALLKDLIPGIEFPRPLTDAGTDLHVSTYARIKSNGKEYVALAYYQPYPSAPRRRNVSYALLELQGEEYRLRLDQVASDGGTGLEYQQPFLYTVDAEDLVVFSSCYRGCEYRFFRLGATPTQVTLQAYDGLGMNESLSGRGDSYRFDESGPSATLNVARSGDAACCPSGGTVRVFYELRGNEFRIARVERNVSAQ
jgi:hypothetical protein